MIEDNKKNFNGILIASFLFQYSLLISLMKYINLTILITVVSIILISFLLYNNYNQRIVKSVLYSFFGIFILVCIKSIMHINTQENLLLNFIMYALPAAVFFFFDFSSDSFLKTGSVLSIVNFFVISLYPFQPGFSYMRFGYAMLPTTIFCIYFLSNTNNRVKRTVFFLIFFISSFELFLFGARGAFFALILYFVINTLIINRKHIVRNIILVIMGVFSYMYLEKILRLFETLISKFGLYSYTLVKYRLQITSNWAFASSGRSTLYINALNKIQSSPFFGNPIDLSIDDGKYVHNVFLQITQDFGVIALIIFIIILFDVLYYLFSSKISVNTKNMLAILFSISIGRLMFSSIYWRRPEFWLFIFLYIAIKSNYKFNNKYNKLEPIDTNMDRLHLVGQKK